MSLSTKFGDFTELELDYETYLKEVKKYGKNQSR